jgi:hypothetical protein
MHKWIAGAVIAVFPMAGLAANQPSIDKAEAIANLQPVEFSLNVKAQILASTPCFKAEGKYGGDEKSKPPTYILEVSLIPTTKPGTACIQVVTYVPLDYTEKPYKGDHDEVLIKHPDGSSLRVPIKKIH